MTEASTWMMLLRTLLSLAAVIAVIYALSWVMKKYLKPERWSKTANGDVRILESLSIDPRKKLLVVEVQNQRILLGVSDHSIQKLCDMGPAPVGEVGHV